MKYRHKPVIPWDQADFEKLRATWSLWRIGQDNKALKKIFALAEDSPLLAEALEWAEQHGIKFFIDRTAVNVGGYYTHGTGVVGIAEKTAQDPLDAAGTLVHEIRHAWQEYNGFGASRSYIFSEDFITVSLREADAKALGLRTRDQVREAFLKRNNKPVPSAQQASLAEERADLAAKFQAQFSMPKWTTFYGEKVSKRHGQNYGLFPVDETKPDKGLPERRYEFRPKRVKYRPAPMKINNIQDVLRLGVNFSGTKNYLTALQPDVLPKLVLRPSLADTFWNAANDGQRKLTTQLRKAGLKRKLRPESRKPRHPWP